MVGSTGVNSTPSQVHTCGTDAAFRLRAPSTFLIGGLLLLTSWWFLAGTALARSYPPALGCAVAGSASAGGGVFDVRGMGFRPGAPVLVSVAGRRAGSVVADPTGSFEAAWPVPGLTPGARVTAADGSCAVTSVLSVHKQRPLPSEAPPQPLSGEAPPRPLLGDPVVAVIPLIPLTGLAPHLFLGLAGALLLSGAALTGLTGRWGHRSERRPAAASSVSRTLPLLSGPPKL